MRDRRSGRRTDENDGEAGGLDDAGRDEAPMRPQSASTSACCIWLNEIPSGCHRPPMAADLLGERTPSMTSSPPSSCWLCARITSSPRPLRLAAARLTRPRSESSGAPAGAVIRIATSPPAGSYSASRTCRGQSAPKTRLAVVTPGEPLRSPAPPVPSTGSVGADTSGLVAGFSFTRTQSLRRSGRRDGGRLLGRNQDGHVQGGVRVGPRVRDGAGEAVTSAPVTSVSGAAPS